jgi:hypothetical protein
MSHSKKQLNKQDQNNQQHHQLPPQQQKTRQEHAPNKRGRNAATPSDVCQYHDHERIETRLTR